MRYDSVAKHRRVDRLLIFVQKHACCREISEKDAFSALSDSHGSFREVPASSLTRVYDFKNSNSDSGKGCLSGVFPPNFPCSDAFGDGWVSVILPSLVLQSFSHIEKRKKDDANIHPLYSITLDG